MALFKRIYMDLDAELVNKGRMEALKAGVPFKVWVEDVVSTALKKMEAPAPKKSKKKGGK